MSYFIVNLHIVNSQCLLVNFFLLRTINSKLVLIVRLGKTLKMMLAKFRHQYPLGSLISELVKIDRGTYIVKATIQIDKIVLATALAGADTVESAEDLAKDRAIATLFLDDDAESNNNNLINKADDFAEAQQSQAAEVAEKSLEQPTSVNFSKQTSEPKLEILSCDHAPLSDNSSLESSIPQPNFEEESATESVSPVLVNNNIFGDTFTAEISEDVADSDNNITDNASTSDSIITTPEIEAMHFNEIKQKTDIEIKRLGWTKDQGKEFLMSHYGKRSRLHLTDDQLLEFLHYLEKLPNPVK